MHKLRGRITKSVMLVDFAKFTINTKLFLLQELFLETIAKETYAYTITNKRKTISKKDLDLIINKVDCLCFLEGAMDF